MSKEVTHDRRSGAERSALRLLSAGAAGGIVTGVFARSMARKARHDGERHAARWATALADRVSAEDERRREEDRQFLHATVLQTLEALCAPDSHTRIELLRLQASRDARRLRAFLDGRDPAPDRGFGAVVEGLVAEAGERGLSVEVVEEGEPRGGRALSPRVLAALRLATAEALTNTAKHAGVSSVTLRHMATLDGQSLSVADAGSGFDPDSAAHRHGFGFRHTFAALADIGGSFTVDAIPGGGTVVHLWVPFTEESRSPLTR